MNASIHALDAAAAALRVARKAEREAETLRHRLATATADLERERGWRRQREKQTQIEEAKPHDARADEEGFIGTPDQPVRGVRLYQCDDVVVVVIDGREVVFLDGHGQEINLPDEIFDMENKPVLDDRYLLHCKKMLRELRDCWRSYWDYEGVCTLQEQPPLTFDDFCANLYPANMGYAVDVEALKEVRERTPKPTPCPECGGSPAGCGRCNYTGQLIDKPSFVVLSEGEPKPAEEDKPKTEREPFNHLQAVANMIEKGIPVMVPVNAETFRQADPAKDHSADSLPSADDRD